jgi:putative Ca2+/H+ antiporter (TMEM165/GDT1 family)
MHAFWTAFILIFLAEMGDKTQFMTMALSTRFPARTVITGVCLGTFAVSFLSVALGETVGRLLPYFWINLLAGLAFIAFGIVSLFEKEESEEEDAKEIGKTEKNIEEKHWGPALSVAGAFFLAELGDKTMLATVAIAGREYRFFWEVWLGSSIGLVSANALGLVAGKTIAKKLSAKTLRYLIVLIYVISGAVAIFEAFKSKP